MVTLSNEENVTSSLDYPKINKLIVDSHNIGISGADIHVARCICEPGRGSGNNTTHENDKDQCKSCKLIFWATVVYITLHLFEKYGYKPIDVFF